MSSPPQLPITPQAPAVTSAIAAPLAIPVAWVAEPLEERLRRVEETLAQLRQLQAASPTPSQQASQIQTQPPVEPPAPRNSMLAQLGKRLLEAAVIPSGPVVVPQGTAPASRRSRLVWEFLAELRAMYRMFVDPRYRLSLVGRIVPAVLVFGIITSYFWVPLTSIPWFGRLLEKAVDLVLAFLLFKVLTREARRYRETAPDLPPWLRL